MAIVQVWGMQQEVFCLIVSKQLKSLKPLSMLIKLKTKLRKKFIFNIIEKVYAIPQDELKTNPEALQEKIRKQMTDECLVTPHYDKMPNYKNSKCIRHRQTLH